MARLATAAVVGALGLVAFTVPAQAADPPTPDPETVTADALPTWQINGVVYSQAIVGDTVYVTGSFTRARPPGVNPGGAGEVVANNIFAYRLSTGERVAAFVTNPGLNAQGLVIRASDDGSRLWVGGDFTSVNGTARGHLAALNPANGSVVSGGGFTAPNVGGQVRGLGITASTIYVGGNFPSANGVARTRLAAFQVSSGAMTSWAPAAAGGYVWAMTMSPDKTRVIPAGSFTTLNNQPAYGMGSVMASDGTVVNPWPAQEKIRTAGANGAITSVKADATQVYGTSYAFGAGAAYEGTFAIDPTSGQINWVNDCLGDTYDIAASGNVLYNASHQHDCSVINAWPDTNPRVRWQKAAAQVTYPTDITTKNDAYGWAGQYGLLGLPYAKSLHWYPNFAFGSYTSAGQAGWAVDASADGQWVVYGGEFPRVNGTAQQGLVRFRTKAGAPNKEGPTYATVPSTPTPATSAVSLSAGTVRVSFGSAWDMDDETLTYDVLRNNNTWVSSQTAKSNFWTLPRLGFIDKNLTPGTQARYQVRITDPAGNVLWSPVSNTVTVGTGSPSPYADTVTNDGAQHFWRIGEPSGTTGIDYAGFDDVTFSGGYTRGQAGAITGDSDGATGFNGSDAFAVNSASTAGPNVFSVEAWFKTTSTTGGKIVGFGDQPTGTSNNYDRHIFMSPDGRLWFGVWNNGAYTVNTPNALNDGQWHQAVGTMDPSGVTLYVDGKRIGRNSGTSIAQPYNGYWRIGGDTSWNGNPYFNGTIDDVAVYDTSLPLAKVQSHYTASGRTLDVPTRPSDAYGGAVWDSDPELFWRLGDTTGTTAKDSSANASNGIYQGGYTLGQSGAFDAATNKAVTFNGSNGFVASAQQYSNPRNYSLEAWFKTTSTDGGKILGFGCAQTGLSGCYDRHIYISNDGKLTFGVWTGFTNTITTPNAVNDGQWHYVVGTQSTVDGLKLYLDGVLVGTNGQTDSQAYDGYWRVGGDNHWGCCSPYLAGTIDEVAVYSSVLSPSAISAHFAAAGGNVPNQAPTASFTHTEEDRTVSVDGTGSSDPDGTIASYSWNWGDGTPAGSGATTSHPYASAGTYDVTLTVTDNDGATATKTLPVTVTDPPPNQLPTASFTHTESYLEATVDGSGSHDPDGDIASYSWNWGDGTADGSGAGTSHTYTAAGTYTVTLTVTDDDGGTDTATASVTVKENVAPTASFTHSENDLTTSVNGSGSTDGDGTIASYVWSWGDGTANGSGVTTTHAYANPGTYTVTLTVTDNGGKTDTESASVTVNAPPNQQPTARFTHTESGLATSVNGSTSSDPDGTIASYAWSWGDGTADGSGSSTGHTYAAAGTYTVTLTVTDNRGGTDTASASVTVSAVTVLASDDFGRTTSAGWGAADSGGTWQGTTSSSATVNGGVGRLTMASAGSGPQVYLSGVASTDTDVQVQVSLDKLPVGGSNGVDLGFIARRVAGQGDYRASVRVTPSGAMTATLVRTSSSGTQTAIGSGATVPGGAYVAGTVLNVRVQATGTSPTTLQVKVWRDGTTEPTAWLLTRTDTTAGLQANGSVGLHAYLSGSVTNAPVVARYDTLRVRRASQLP